MESPSVQWESLDITSWLHSGSRRNHSFIDDGEMKWKWFAVDIKCKPGLETIFAENSTHKTVRKNKFSFIKNRKT